ncbi:MULTISPECIES: hypothetical protein [unclassified Cyanobium]|uniref:hypothetical protein n=1 Tax=unclassified Cyanobium TaxID=2627006 RepID=UPI0020CC529F|nr:MULTISPECIES: hypothetical protein [unclassified Cyanobium]MCP9860976.1 hypothetical protein [Cyanobium sp. Cruz-8H5]MCP9868196.1 hypothetical protein [Cyanobium sp. Cruz-8D1]
MPYPLPPTPPQNGDRLRLLPPLGCPGRGEWVVPHEVPRWLAIGFRTAPVPSLDLELSWMPSPRRWDEPALSRGVVLLVNPRALPPQPIQIAWGDGSSETVPWTAFDSRIPEPRHLYADIEDLTITVQVGLLVATLEVALLSCPLPITSPRPGDDPPRVGVGLVLVPGAGLSGNAYDGSRNEQWQLRLHPQGGLGLLPSPIDGQPALVAMHGSGAASRGVRWYSADGPPTLPWQEGAQPPPAPGDLYLDRLSGSIYELEV